MEKKNLKQSSLLAAKANNGSQSNIVKTTKLAAKKWLNHKKILTETIYQPNNITSSAHIRKERLSRSQHQKKDQKEKLNTAANTWSTWSIQNKQGLVKQVSKLNQQMKNQNARIMEFIKQIQPTLDLKLIFYKASPLTKVSLSQKIKSQQQMLHTLACSPREK